MGSKGGLLKRHRTGLSLKVGEGQMGFVGVLYWSATTQRLGKDPSSLHMILCIRY